MVSDSIPEANNSKPDLQAAGRADATALEQAYLTTGMDYERLHAGQFAAKPGMDANAAQRALEDAAAQAAAQTAASMLRQEYLQSQQNPRVEDAAHMTRLDWENHFLEQDRGMDALDGIAALWGEQNLKIPMDQKEFEEFANPITDPYGKYMATKLDSEFNQVARYTSNGEPTQNEYVLHYSDLSDRVTLDWNVTKPAKPLPPPSLWTRIGRDLGLE